MASRGHGKLGTVQWCVYISEETDKRSRQHLGDAKALGHFTETAIQYYLGAMAEKDRVRRILEAMDADAVAP
jgi:hypothetical protein